MEVLTRWNYVAADINKNFYDSISRLKEQVRKIIVFPQFSKMFFGA